MGKRVSAVVVDSLCVVDPQKVSALRLSSFCLFHLGLWLEPHCTNMHPHINQELFVCAPL